MQFREATKKISKSLVNVFSNTKTAADSIVKKVIRPIFNKSFGFLKHSPRVLAALISVVILLSCTVTVALATDATAAYSLVYNGKNLAFVKDPSVLAEAEILAADKINNQSCNPYIIEGDLVNTIAGQDELKTSQELADILIENSKEIVSTTVLLVNNQPIAVGENIQASLDNYLTTYKTNNNLKKVEFCEGITVGTVYTLKDTAENLPDIEEYFAQGNSLAVQTVEVVTETKPILYKTVYTKSDKYAVGTNVVTKNGAKGSAEVTYEVAKANGVVVNKKQIAYKVISEPVERHVTVGSKRIIAADKNGTAPMCWPVKRVSNCVVTSYMGDGRGHKGMDIAAPKGTPIYAATGGTVTFAGWDGSGYGYKIVVQHDNGLSTLYAHCSAIFVKAGEKVLKGETIAAVGSTGRSTGNHLHFEVRKNGKILNPVNFIGSN